VKATERHRVSAAYHRSAGSAASRSPASELLDLPRHKVATALPSASPSRRAACGAAAERAGARMAATAAADQRLLDELGVTARGTADVERDVIAAAYAAQEAGDGDGDGAVPQPQEQPCDEEVVRALRRAAATAHAQRGTRSRGHAAQRFVRMAARHTAPAAVHQGLQQY